MKRLSTFVIGIAGILICGCNGTDKGGSRISIDRTSLNFVADSPVEQTINLTTADDTEWEVKQKPEWITINPDNGTGSCKIGISAQNNISEKRDGTVLFECFDNIVSVKVSQDKYEAPVIPAGNNELSVTLEGAISENLKGCYESKLVYVTPAGERKLISPWTGTSKTLNSESFTAQITQEGCFKLAMSVKKTVGKLPTSLFDKTRDPRVSYHNFFTFRLNGLTKGIGVGALNQSHSSYVNETFIDKGIILETNGPVSGGFGNHSTGESRYMKVSIIREGENFKMGDITFESGNLFNN